MEQWCVFTDFYDDIPSEKEVLSGIYNTKDNALEAAVHQGLLMMERFKSDDFIADFFESQNNKHDDKHKMTVVYEPASVTIYEKRTDGFAPIRKWSCKENARG